MSIDQLINRGIVELNRQECSEIKTLLVIGSARSGTSAVAGALSCLGVNFGEHATPPIFEDVNLASAIELDDERRVQKIIQRANNKHSVWGFKRPSMLHSLEKTVPMFRNPKLIFVFRDLLAISNRNAISMNTDVLSNMGSTLEDYSKILQFLKKTNCHSVLISNEKFLRYTADNLKYISTAFGLTCSEMQMNDAIKFVDHEPFDYIDKSRISKSCGEVKLERSSITGWACYEYKPDFVDVNIYVNDQYRCTVSAVEPCSTFALNRTKKRVDIGFTKDTQLLDLKDGDQISARVKGDVFDLLGSPMRYIEE